LCIAISFNRNVKMFRTVQPNAMERIELTFRRYSIEFARTNGKFKSSINNQLASLLLLLLLLLYNDWEKTRKFSFKLLICSEHGSFNPTLGCPFYCLDINKIKNFKFVVDFDF